MAANVASPYISLNHRALPPVFSLAIVYASTSSKVKSLLEGNKLKNGEAWNTWSNASDTAAYWMLACCCRNARNRDHLMFCSVAPSGTSEGSNPTT